MNLVEILGVDGFEQTESLKTNVRRAIKELKIPTDIKDVYDLEALMNSSIRSIPALRINGRVVLQKDVPQVPELKVLLQNHLQPSQNQFSMKKILVPTDFSNTARNAYHFALEMAQAYGASLKLFHSFQPELDPAYPYLSYNTESFIDGKKDLLEKFKSHTLAPNEGGIATAIDVDTQVLAGFAAEEIVKQSEEGDVDMIVMGTTGESGLFNKLFGSVSSHVAQKAHCPVLLVPGGVKFENFKNVLYASNYQSADEVMLQQLMDFTGTFESNIHFVHVVENYDFDYAVREMKFEQVFREKAPSLAFNMVTIENSSVIEAVNKYVKENNIDMVVMATSHRSFIEGFLHKSMTKQMVLNTDVPLMVMHFDD